MKKKSGAPPHTRVRVQGLVGGSVAVNEYLTCVEWRDVRPITGARHYDQFCGARVVGESLREHGIYDGDYAIFRLTFEEDELVNGRLVGCRTPHGRVLKYYHRLDDGRVMLRSANREYPDLFFDASEVHVEGLLVRTERDWE